MNNWVPGDKSTPVAGCGAMRPASCAGTHMDHLHQLSSAKGPNTLRAFTESSRAHWPSAAARRCRSEHTRLIFASLDVTLSAVVLLKQGGGLKGVEASKSSSVEAPKVASGGLTPDSARMSGWGPSGGSQAYGQGQGYSPQAYGAAQAATQQPAAAQVPDLRSLSMFACVGSVGVG